MATSLHDAVGEGDIDLVRKLVNGGADVNGLSPTGQTVLERAANHYVGGLIPRTCKEIIDILGGTTKLRYSKVTRKGDHTALELFVDQMLHELGYINSDVAEERRYKKYF